MMEILKFIIGIINIGCFFWISFTKMSWIYGFFGTVFTYVLIYILPFCKKQESTWIFFISTLTTMPINIKLAKLAVSLFFHWKNFLASKIVFIIAYLFCLAVEELFLGIGGRVIWHKQNESLYEK